MDREREVSPLQMLSVWTKGWIQDEGVRIASAMGRRNGAVCKTCCHSVKVCLVLNGSYRKSRIKLVDGRACLHFHVIFE
jgi:hypothetical protein